MSQQRLNQLVLLSIEKCVKWN